MGSTRVTLNRNKLSNGQADIIYYADYYLFGKELRQGGVPNRFGYQGSYSEKDNETGWNNFDLRNYDAEIWRWISVDPEGSFKRIFIFQF
ncbi:RHS repeat-associated core domain-containing protein [Sphingobacterium cellulitidis]|uniref:RHS repeat-associated core domain-containing protein n=1 Tax=Sphingobacterium cellulitidis TaxID=1768011 RepID=UPI003C79D150